MEEPPKAVGQIQGAGRVSFPLPMTRLSSADDAATWAHRIMAAKNSLAAADARRVEDAFAAKIATTESGDGEVVNRLGPVRQ
jgi:hypothetical protein